MLRFIICDPERLMISEFKGGSCHYVSRSLCCISSITVNHDFTVVFIIAGSGISVVIILLVEKIIYR